MTTSAQELARRVIQSRAGGKVERCHAIPHNTSYSNAAHSWGVAMLMWYLWPQDFPRLAIFCLSHDVPEAWVGDIPSPTMRYSGMGSAICAIETALNTAIGLPAEEALNEEDFAKLKACDRLEFYLWCRDQVALGNHFALEGLKEIRHFLATTNLPYPANRVYEALEETSTVAKLSGVMREVCAVP